jgi:hypothetical protein
MDPMLLLILCVMALTLWTYLPDRVRQVARQGLGPLVHGLADGVRFVARRVGSLMMRVLRWMYGVKPLSERAVKPLLDADPARDGPVPHYVEMPARTDGRTDGNGAADGARPAKRRLEVDRTRAAVVAELVDNGWSVEQIRDVLKGSNGDIGAEVKAARESRQAADDPHTRRAQLQRLAGVNGRSTE